MLTCSLFPPKYLYDSKLGKGGRGLSSNKTHYNFKPACPCVCRVDVESGQSSLGPIEGFQVGSQGGNMCTYGFRSDWIPLVLTLLLCLLEPHPCILRCVYTGLPTAPAGVLLGPIPCWWCIIRSSSESSRTLSACPLWLALPAPSPHESQRRQILNYLAFDVCGHALLSTLHLPSS